MPSVHPRDARVAEQPVCARRDPSLETWSETEVCPWQGTTVTWSSITGSLDPTTPVFAFLTKALGSLHPEVGTFIGYGMWKNRIGHISVVRRPLSDHRERFWYSLIAESDFHVKMVLILCIIVWQLVVHLLLQGKLRLCRLFRLPRWPLQFHTLILTQYIFVPDA